MSEDLYQEQLLEEVKNPAHRGELNEYTHKSSHKNSFCGDKLTIYLQIESGVVKAVGWDGESCAVSTASMSVLSKKIIGKKISDLQHISLESLMKELGLEQISPNRKLCLSLPIQTLQKALMNESGSAKQ